jgi:RNA polymerase sigma factor (sigma-70 family)
MVAVGSGFRGKGVGMRTAVRGHYSGALIQQLERLFHQGTAVGLTEGELLERFVRGRDETAFEALIARHGPMVLGVCRQLLRDPNDVDDAFQATFLVLVRKAGTLRRCDLLGNWLYGVAHRVATRARTLATRRIARASQVPVAAARLGAASGHQPPVWHEAAVADHEPRPWLHEEVGRLPDKYRVPVLLCYFEGLTHDQAARRLGWPIGTVKGRLARARDLLKRRLARRGVVVSTMALSAHLGISDVKAAVPANLEYATLAAARAAAWSASGPVAAASAVSLPVAALTEGVLHAMIMSQIKVVTLPLLAVAAVTTGVVLSTTHGSFGQGATAPENPGGSPPAVAKGQAASDAQPAPTPDSPRPAREHQADALRASLEMFDILVTPHNNFSSQDVRRIGRWSLRLLEASRDASRNPGGRAEAYEAHRDRMKKLVDAISSRPAPTEDPFSPPAGQTTDMARALLDAAEDLVEQANGPSAVPASDMMVKMMGGRPAGAAAGAAEMLGMMNGMEAMMRGRMPGQSVDAGRNPRSSASAKSASAGATAKASATPDQRARSASTPVRPAQSQQTGAATSEGAAGAGRGGSTGGPRMMAGMGRAGLGGMAGGRYGRGLGGGSDELQNRTEIARTAASLAASAPDSKTQGILKLLETPSEMSFAEPTPLGDVLKFIKATQFRSRNTTIPIYVDPKGLEDAGATLSSPVVMDLDGIPLKTSLRLALKQLGLAYCVRDGVLIISSVEGVLEELREAQSELQASRHPDQMGGMMMMQGGGMM